MKGKQVSISIDISQCHSWCIVAQEIRNGASYFTIVSYFIYNSKDQR